MSGISDGQSDPVLCGIILSSRRGSACPVCGGDLFFVSRERGCHGVSPLHRGVLLFRGRIVSSVRPMQSGILLLGRVQHQSAPLPLLCGLW